MMLISRGSWTQRACAYLAEQQRREESLDLEHRAREERRKNKLSSPTKKTK